jgi:hypothetical protein
LNDREVRQNEEQRSNSENYQILREALAIALQAIEKQITKEPVMGSEVYNSATDEPYKVPSCPMCGEPTYNCNWCQFCGQRLSEKELNGED